MQLTSNTKINLSTTALCNQGNCSVVKITNLFLQYNHYIKGSFSSQIAELGHSPTAGRHKIWSFTPTHSPVLGRRTDPNSHHVLNVTNLVMIQLEGEEERDEAKGGGGGGGGGRGKGGERGEEMREGEGVDQQVNGKELQKQVCVFCCLYYHVRPSLSPRGMRV